MSPRANLLALYLRENAGWMFPTLGMIVGGILTYSTINNDLDKSASANARQDKEIEEIRKEIKEAATKVSEENKELTVAVSKIAEGQARMEGKLDMYIRISARTSTASINSFVTCE